MEQGQKAVSVDDIHNSIDQMVLSIFETMRVANLGEPENPQAHAQGILAHYKTILNSIDNLSGISKSPEFLSGQLENISQEYEECRKDIFELEDKLQHLDTELETRLLKVTLLSFINKFILSFT